MKIEYKSDCRFFRGDLPCKPHKTDGSFCDKCAHYDKTDGKILIIKLGAIGDVIRTTTLLPKIKEVYPTKEIWWITNSPEILPKSKVDKILKNNAENLLLLSQVDFDIIYGLDKDDVACAMTKSFSAKKKFGFTLLNGKPTPINSLAEHKFLTGISDEINKANVKSYPEEIYEICGLEYEKQDYILDCEPIEWNIPNDGKKIVGLNTGCGNRWTSRLWSNEKWIELAQKLKSDGYFPMFIGGKQEHEKNLLLAEKSGCYYPGNYNLQEFISLINQCDAVVTAVTMAMHLAIGMKKQLILINNIFNPHEFELYGRGEIVSPSKPCTCYFSPRCVNEMYKCMDHLSSEDIFRAVKRHI